MRDIINSKLEDIGITASYSHMYLAMTWSATGAMLVVAIYWCGACCFGRKEKRSVSRESLGAKSMSGQSAVDEGSIVDEKPKEFKGWRGFR